VTGGFYIAIAECTFDRRAMKTMSVERLVSEDLLMMYRSVSHTSRLPVPITLPLLS